MRVTAVIAVILTLAGLGSAHAGSARMSLDVSPGVVAEADYWPGAADLPAVLVLHGFLQTRDFPTVRRLAEALADEGFNVLLPTLSLGVDRRHQSLACEAIHLHTMEQDIAELRAWTDWLIERAGKPPVLIGHSAGGAQLTALVDAYPDLQVAKVVLISLSYFEAEQHADQWRALHERAAAEAAKDPEAVADYALSYCKRYVTTPVGLLSYLAWDRARLAGALRNTRLPVTVIYGEKDDRIDRPWLDALHRDGLAVRKVAGADHFFGSSYEFDLLDEILQALSEGGHG